MKLLLSALTKTVIGLGLMAALIFAPAGTFGFPGAWRLIGLLFIPMMIIGIVFFIWDPETLSKRLRSKEERTKQKGVVALSGLQFIACFVIAGLDFRWGWSNIPAWVIWPASAVFLISYGIYAEVMRENRWLSRSIEVMEGQQVVSTGLYGVVRHPMYMATIGMFLAMPLIMGSWWAFLVMIPYVPIIVIRVKDEEELLAKELPGYEEYKKKVKWRLHQFIW
jgi:protein-S-isoprenylcysteine O-methyltransferase Ste14